METFMAAPIPLIILDDDDDDEIQITGTTVRHSASACTAQTSISQGESLVVAFCYKHRFFFSQLSGELRIVG